MKEVRDTLEAWRADGIGAGRAVVVRTFGSAPRPEGAVLLRADDGRIAGSVSGGCVEGAAAEEIERARRDGHSRVIRYGISDEEAWDVGLACGGTIDVLVEPAVPATRRPPRRTRAGTRRRDPAAGRRAAAGVRPVTSRARASSRRRRSIVGASGIARGVAGLGGRRRRARGRGPATRCSEARRGPSTIGGRQVFVEAFPVKPRLVVVGAVEVARSLVRLARELGYETIVIDGRASFATPERFPPDAVDRLIVGWPDEVADEIGLGPDDAVAVLTHDVKFDEPAIVEALRRGCRYVGAVGSKKTQGDRRERLREAGVTDDELARLRGPVGLDLGGRHPAETALAIIAEVVAERYGGSGRPMVETAKGLGAPDAAAAAASAPVGAAAG